MHIIVLEVIDLTDNETRLTHMIERKVVIDLTADDDEDEHEA